MKPLEFDTLIIDIGGVLLTNGWDHHARELAVRHFKLDFDEFNHRHSILFDTYERGNISLEDYLRYVVFYESRPFTLEAFEQFIFSQSQPLTPMLDLIHQYKRHYALNIVAITNEGKELMRHRIRTFALHELIDFFICSGFVHFRKPDPEIYQLAIDLCQIEPSKLIYIDDRKVLVEVGKNFGFHTIHHIDVPQTKLELDTLLNIRK